jgi:nucleotide-binding universal stress UspA family protein
MVATDGSEGADRAVDVAADLAKAWGGELSILTVGGNLSGVEMMQLARAERDLGAALDAMSNKILMQSKERARRIGAPTIKVEVAWGDPAKTIIETDASRWMLSWSAAGAAADLLVCCLGACHRRSQASLLAL